MTTSLHLARRWTAGEPPRPIAPAGLLVRPIRSGDANALGRLLWNGFGAVGPDGFSSAEVAAHDARDTLAGKWGPLVEAACLAGIADGAMVAAAVVVRDDAHDLRPLLAFLVTEPWYRRHGAAAHLLREAIRHLDQLGVRELHLAVDPANPARELYRQAGFVVVPTRTP
jgi:ribosomal protein S18 acetylase RimI-like enzyme